LLSPRKSQRLLAYAVAELGLRVIQEELAEDEVRWRHHDYNGNRICFAVTNHQIKMAPPMGEFMGMMEHADRLAADLLHQQQLQLQRQRHLQARAAGEPQQGCIWLCMHGYQQSGLLVQLPHGSE
jgi:hypothetical protein